MSEFSAGLSVADASANAVSGAHVIGSDAEAIAVAHSLAKIFAVEASVRDRERRLPWNELARYSASGLGGITVPREFGGADVSYATLADVFRILSAADPALGQIPQNHFGVLGLIRELATPAQQRRIFGLVLAGQRLGNAGPERGTPTILHQNTTLSSAAGKLLLNGTRFYSTGALFAHWIPTRALDDEKRAVLVLVPRDAPGVEVIDDWNAFGQRTTASGTVRFAQVAVDAENVLPVWKMADRPGLSGPVSQLIHAAIDAGIARAALEDTQDFVRDKSRPWIDANVARASDDPYIIHAIGRLQTDLHAAEEVLRESAEEIDAIAAAFKDQAFDAAASAQASVAVAYAKIATTEIALQASEKLFELAGSSATRAEPNLGRHWRNARVHTLHDPVRWKYHLLGNFELNGALPRRHQWN